jgi:AcrR family transcriptional regulator
MFDNGRNIWIVRLHLAAGTGENVELSMELEKKDRRTRKTRQLLRSTLLELLQEKRYEDISVQDIIERADVARSTFYVHYMDKDDLLTGQYGIFAENLGTQLLAHAAPDSGAAFSSLKWFYHVQAQRDILKVIAKDSAMDMAMKTLRGIIHRSVQEGMQTHTQSGKDASIPLPLLVDYLTDTLMTLIRWWFKDGMKYTPEQMDEIFQQLAMPGVLSVLRGTGHGTR